MKFTKSKKNCYRKIMSVTVALVIGNTSSLVLFTRSNQLVAAEDARGIKTESQYEKYGLSSSFVDASSLVKQLRSEKSTIMFPAPIITTTSTTTSTTTTSTTTSTSTTTTESATSTTTATSPVEEPKEVEIINVEEESIVEEDTIAVETPVEVEVTAQPEQASTSGFRCVDNGYVSYDDAVRLANTVGSEYGSDWVAVSEKAKVVATVINRVNSSRWPNTVYDVLVQPYQYNSSYADTYFHGNVTASCIEAVDYYFEHSDEFGNIQSFYGDGTWNHFS